MEAWGREEWWASASDTVTPRVPLLHASSSAPPPSFSRRRAVEVNEQMRVGTPANLTPEAMVSVRLLNGPILLYPFSKYLDRTPLFRITLKKDVT